MNPSDDSYTDAEGEEPSDFSGSQRPLYAIKANLFKGLAHPVRVRVLEVLCTSDEVSVTELLDDTGLEASNLSQHLSVLRQNHLVVAERRGSQVFYALAYPQVADLLRLSRSLLAEILQQTKQQLVSTTNLPALPPRTRAQEK
ncbi:ArsR/SmtB family transcription factor [Agromyces bauzanensis]|uniref:Transcriptional regulator n=1 Tax=Agromyces bauzanensis TaxID=1308924 RepID=A0A917PPI9_9MICO|nr:metalloregulator ArsR/SmtB family transcription factor [Agromyces bauzanensis]GGJ86887.1 transcriptional regulator [Agromyces bauzanensis]